MVAAIGLVDALDRAAELPIAFLDQEAIFRGRHHVVDVADHMHERHARFREGRERVDRIAAVGECRRFVGEVIGLEACRPILGATLALSLAARPALEIADGGIAIDH